MRTVYTAQIGHILPDRRHEALEALEQAVSVDHPGLHVHDWMLGDDLVAVLIATLPDTDSAASTTRLDGWGHGFLTLTRVGA